LNKLLITIQGRTLILYYQVKQGMVRNNTAHKSYIEVLPSDELARFDLKGLTPDMFCVNIADMVNIRGLFSGQVENEKQLPVARWLLNREEYLQLTGAPRQNLTHEQIVNLLASMPGYQQESDRQYIDFEESVVPRHSGEPGTFSGYRLTIVTEEIEGSISSYAYYYLDTLAPQGWQGTPPPPADYEAIQRALAKKLQAIADAGVILSQLTDETDYAQAG
jgi:hypothetical protein